MLALFYLFFHFNFYNKWVCFLRNDSDLFIEYSILKLKHFTGRINTPSHLCFHKTFSTWLLCFPGLIGSYGLLRPHRPLHFIRKMSHSFTDKYNRGRHLWFSTLFNNLHYLVFLSYRIVFLCYNNTNNVWILSAFHILPYINKTLRLRSLSLWITRTNTASTFRHYTSPSLWTNPTLPVTIHCFPYLPTNSMSRLHLSATNQYLTESSALHHQRIIMESKK